MTGAGRIGRPAPLRRARERGFTLLEVLVAFLIVAMTLGAAYASIGAAAVSAGRAEAALQALTRAESALAQVGAAIPLAPGETVLEEDGWTVRITIEEHRRDGAATWRAIGLTPFSVTAEARPADGQPTRLTTLRAGAAS
ncbi:MAG: type II secretion system GspH family protein [Caulobacterales bacterium]|nr:type II secretion system GspH family protein [Caulobacterales bacterium]